MVGAWGGATLPWTLTFELTPQYLLCSSPRLRMFSGGDVATPSLTFQPKQKLTPSAPWALTPPTPAFPKWPSQSLQNGEGQILHFRAKLPGGTGSRVWHCLGLKGERGPPGSLQASRKVFSAIKALFLAFESVCKTHSLHQVLGPGKECVAPSPAPGPQPGLPCSPGAGQ